MVLIKKYSDEYNIEIGGDDSKKTTNRVVEYNEYNFFE